MIISKFSGCVDRVGPVRDLFPSIRMATALGRSIQVVKAPLLLSLEWLITPYIPVQTWLQPCQRVGGRVTAMVGTSEIF